MTLSRAIRCRARVRSKRRAAGRLLCGHGRDVLEGTLTSVDRYRGPLALWAPVRTLRVRAAAPNLSMGEEALGVEGFSALEHEVHRPGEFRRDDR